MKRSLRIIKATFISLMLVMGLGLAAPLASSLHGLSPVPAAYAQEDNQGADQGGQKKSFEEIVADLPPAQAPQNQQNSEDIVSQVASMASKTHRLFAPLINFFAFQIGNFLGTDYIFDGAMGRMLQNIWVVSRNIVNIAFVFLLLWLALQEIFVTPFGGEIDLPKKLITFVLLLVAVNFSWLASRIVLDAANVATHVVFAIPSGLSGGQNSFNPGTIPQCEVNTDPEQPTKGACVPTAIFAPADSGESSVLYFEDSGEDGDNCSKVKEAYADAYNEDRTRNTDAKKENQKFWYRTSICMENLNLTTYDQNTAVIYLTYGMAKIQNLVNANKSTNPVQLSVGVLLSLILQTVYTIALAMLFVALVIRMLVLWIFVAFSPFVVLVIWFSGREDKQLGEFKFGYNEFIRWAFVPAKVGAVFAVSFMMIAAGQVVSNVKTTLVDNATTKSSITNLVLEPQSLFMGIGSLQTFIWLLMTVVILWMGVFAILNDMPIIKNVTSRVSDWGSAIGRFVASAPKVAPIIPLGKGGETTSIQKIFEPISTTKLDTYSRGWTSTPEEVRKLNANAGSTRAKRAVQDGLVKIDSGNFRAADARSVAIAHGFTDLKRMMQTERDVLKKAFTKSGISSGDADKLYEALDKESRATGGLTRAIDRTSAKAPEKKEGPPGTVSPPAPPAAPPAGGGTPPPPPKPPAQG